MDNLSKRALIGLTQFQAAVALLLFLPAWSLSFWDGWIYWIVFSICVLLITLYFLRHDPALIERRLDAGPGAEQQKSQKIIQAIASIFLCTLFIVAGIDHRLNGPAVPIAAALFADALVALGFLIIFFVFKENSHTAAVVTVEANQPVISTGPYRLVRHPMYAGAVLLFLATPFALASWWALLPALALCGVIVVRLIDEERYLSRHLMGYDAYRQTVRYRLIPLVW